MTHTTEQTQVESTETTETKPQETVETDGQKHYKNDLLKFKADLKAEREAREAAEKKLQAREEQSLAEKNNFKELYEREKQKREEIEENHQTNGQIFINTQKTNAIREEAIKAGIIDSALEDLEFLKTDLVEVETTSSGTLNVIGAKEYVEDLKVRKSHWFNKGTININNSNPDFQKTKELSAKDLLDLQRKDPVKYKEHMQKRLQGN